MLCDVGCEYVIVGHSERRAAGYDNDETVRRKALAALDAGLKPIVCVGETLEQREQGCTEQIVKAQVEHGLRDLALSDVVVAYEPVWAIGTGRTATAEQVQSVHVLIREVAGSLAGSEIAGALRILYGGSVKPDNAAELFARPDVDGGLIGGASLDAESFVRIVKSV
jgi:triosephosphate isomerase